jgi:hypothetical protein
MNKTIFVLALLFLSILVYAREVPATNQGIAYASPGDYIIRSSGEKIILSQADIDYARKQLGLTTTTTTTQNRPAASNTSNSTANYKSNIYKDNMFFVFIIIFGCIAHICLTVTVYKMKGGEWACFYFFLAPLALLLFLAGVGALSKVGKKREDIHHYFH